MNLLNEVRIGLLNAVGHVCQEARWHPEGASSEPFRSGFSVSEKALGEHPMRAVLRVQGTSTGQTRRQ